MNKDLRRTIISDVAEGRRTRMIPVLSCLGIAASTWYRIPVPADKRGRPGPTPSAVPDSVRSFIISKSKENPWYGYHKIGVICRWADSGIQDRQVYLVMRAEDLLQKPQCRNAEIYQAAKLYELLPQAPNDLWQTDVTYIHIPGHGWWYVITVIDYYSRYLLAARLTNSCSAFEATLALTEARKEAERLHGKLLKDPFAVTDNGPCYIARRFQEFVKGQYQHVRIQYRTPQQLGLLERFHRTLKDEEVYWRLYENPAHARTCIKEFHERYNHRRPHWGLQPVGGGDMLTPVDVYVHGKTIVLPKWQKWARKAKEKLDAQLEKAA